MGFSKGDAYGVLFPEEGKVIEPKDVTVLERSSTSDDLIRNNFIQFNFTDKAIIFNDNTYVSKDGVDKDNETGLFVEENVDKDNGKRVQVNTLELPEPGKSKVSPPGNFNWLISDILSDDIDDKLHSPSMCSPSEPQGTSQDDNLSHVYSH